MTIIPRAALAASLALLALVPIPAAAQEHGAMSGMDHGSTGPDAAADPAADAMDRMMADMHAVDPTGDADADFLLLMIPHHQSAVEMSRAMLPDIDDPEVAALARAVIASQETEIETMRAMLERLGHAPDAAE